MITKLLKDAACLEYREVSGRDSADGATWPRLGWTVGWGSQREQFFLSIAMHADQAF